MDRRAFFERIAASFSVLLSRPTYAEARSVQLVMIVSKDSPLQDIELADLRRVFGGEPVADPKGRKLIPFNHPARSPDRVAFDRKVLGMDPDQVAKYWIDRKIRAQSGPPRTVSSLETLLTVVSRLAGAIGYVRPEYVNSEVRAIKVSGKAAGSPGYPLVFKQ